MPQQTPGPEPAPTHAVDDAAVAGVDGRDVLLLTEEALDDGDAERIAALHEVEGVLAAYRVLVPADT